MQELIDKLDIYGKIDALGLIAACWNAGTEMMGYLENTCGWGMIPSFIVGWLVGPFIVLWAENKTIIIVILIILIIGSVILYLDRTSEKRRRKKEIKKGKNK